MGDKNKHDNLYATALPLIEERGDQVVFGGVGDATMTWGDSDEYGPGRPIAGTEFVIDRRYWELCGKPDKLVVGIASEAGWDGWVSQPPRTDLCWMEATGVSDGE